jgi:deoxyribodipyrimidine photo-lyase
MTIHGNAQTIPQHILSLLQSLRARHLFANIEYEVDELRRDIAMCKLAKENGIQSVFVHDRCIVEPGVVFSKQGQPYTVGPFHNLDDR